MKYLIRLQREGWYFAGFKGPSGKAEIGRIQDAKIYNSKREALNDLSRMGHYGQRVVAITQIGRLSQNGNRVTPGQFSRNLNEQQV